MSTTGADDTLTSGTIDVEIVVSVVTVVTVVAGSPGSDVLGEHAPPRAVAPTTANRDASRFTEGPE